MLRSVAKQRVSKHGAATVRAASPFETHRFAMLLRVRRGEV
jgi:hypothetical protein